MAPHPPFPEVQASRPDWREEQQPEVTKTRKPDWKFGQGANSKEGADKKHISFGPYDEGRNPGLNYKLLISGIVPRPIGFFGTVAADGKSTNLSPMSYTQVVAHDPPTFVVGFAGNNDSPKDTLRNLRDQGECTINMISEHFVEAANSTSVDAPHGVSEWAMSGLTPASCDVVKAARVAESLFSVEGKLVATHEIQSKAKPGTVSGVMAVIEGVRFWAREDAIDESKSQLDPNVLKPVARMGGITYSRLGDMFEIPRPVFEQVKQDPEVQPLIKPKPDAASS